MNQTEKEQTQILMSFKKKFFYSIFQENCCKIISFDFSIVINRKTLNSQKVLKTNQILINDIVLSLFKSVIIFSR